MFDFGSFGTVQVDLFTQLTPQSVNNFLGNYVSTGRYSNTMVHRVDTGLGVVQGGGFNSQAGNIVTASDPMIPLEYSHPNARGTIAMARTGEINSATSQWFFNTKDNSSTLGQSNGGGYTVFGQVVGSGMNVIDAIAAVPTFAYSSPFNQVPLTNFTQQDKTNGVDPLPHIVPLQAVSVVKTHASFQNPYNHLDINNNNNVNANDAAGVIQDLLLNGNHDLTATFGSEGHRLYLDVNGDGKISAQDALQIVQAVLLGGSASSAATLTDPRAEPLATALVAEPLATALVAEPLATALVAEPLATALVAVPEPTTLALAAVGAAALIGFGWRQGASARRRAA
jgi:peptidyl-prolyl cis-trans isomerase A (cyclophilin A)